MANHSADHVSLSEVHRSVPIPPSRGIARRLLAFGGPAYLVSVGYMDPGNWATDLEGGARFGYSLLWVLLMSNLMAVLLQTLSARVGIVTGRDLAQLCRDNYPPVVNFMLWVLCEIAIAAMDLAEVLGTAIALNLLFGLDLFSGVIITAADVFLLLALQRLGMRKLEAVIISLVLLIGGCFLIELIISKPDVGGIARGFIPSALTHESLFVAIGMLGATVMPHNLYLHSALVQTRDVENTIAGKREACKFNLIDSVIALNGALFINGAILVLAAAAFFSRGQVVTEIQQAHQLLSPLLGTTLASTLFAVALLASGQSSTVTGTLAGQIVMEGFLHLRIRPFFRRLITRSIAIIPAAIVIYISGEGSTMDLLILSQVILSMQLAFAIIPLIHFTSDRRLMGEFVSGKAVKLFAWLTALIVVSLNIFLLAGEVSDAIAGEGLGRTVALALLPVLAGVGILLLYVTFKPLIEKKLVRRGHQPLEPSLEGSQSRPFRRIGVALDRSAHDAPVLQRAAAMAQQAASATSAKGSGSPGLVSLLLIHVSESAQSKYFGETSSDTITIKGEEYLLDLQRRIVEQLGPEGSIGIEVSTILGFGSARREIVRIAQEQDLDLLILGAHGHRGLKDLLFGATVSPVRHELDIPIMVVK